MKDFKNHYGGWGLVLGGAQGLGEAFVFQLAKKGMNVIIVDKQLEKMEALKKRVKALATVQVVVKEQDLATPDAYREVMQVVREYDCRLFIYSAAHSPLGLLRNVSEEELDRCLNVNARTLLKLCRSFSRHLIARKSPGGMVLISSLAGTYGNNLVATYGATKAFTWNLGEALHFELESHRIDVLSVICGVIDTPNFRATRPEFGRMAPRIDSPDRVAALSLKKLGKRVRYVPGASNQAAHFLLERLLPRRLSAWLMNRTTRQMYRRYWKPD